ncbi:MAG: P-II family nitrogen regulator, partial [Smithella sp.]
KEMNMKEIKAIIRPFKLLEVCEALKEIEGLPGVTVSQIRGFGKGRAKNAKDKVTFEMVEFVPRIQLEVVVDEEMVDKVVDVIQRYAHTGNTGDGKIFVVNVEEVVKIRTNERGRDAI